MSHCGCESSWCPTHKPGALCPNQTYESSARMVYVGRVCNSCARTVVAHDGASYVTRPFGAWNGR